MVNPPQKCFLLARKTTLKCKVVLKIVLLKETRVYTAQNKCTVMNNVEFVIKQETAIRNNVPQT